MIMISAVAEEMRMNVEEVTHVDVTSFLNWYCMRKDRINIEKQRLKKWKRK